MKYEEVISRQMKGRQAEYHGNRYQKVDSGSIDQKSTTTRKELAKIAGTSEGSVQRTKLILEKGTPEQTGRQLTKTELVQMAQAVEKQVAVEAEVKMLTGKKDPTTNFGEGDRHKRESVTKAAESIGVSAQTYRDMKLVTEKGSDEQIERMNKGGRGFFSKSW